VGYLPEAHKYVADKFPLAQYLVEPGLLVVVETFEVVGAGVGQLVAVPVDDAQIHQPEAIGPLVDLPEQAAEIFLNAEFFEGLRCHDHCQDRGPFLQEDFNGIALGSRQVVDLVFDALLI
jgi:hypothetical protein